MATFERLGPYLIERSLGSGGMGSVFLGRDQNTGERAAVKVLAPSLAADAHFRDRFGTEIETLKKLQHPNIVQLLGYGEQDGHLFYAMEMVEGRSLQQELQGGRRFSWREVTRIGVQICQALKHAHDRGIIHRDLKPANLLYTLDEQIKLADFGIARLYGMSQLTVTGGVIGTADYMSPEQGEGKPVTLRSDLFSLGSVLFALLTGRPPFASRSPAEVIHKLRYQEAIPVRNLAPDTPEEFELIIAQLLEKDPAKRIATAMAVSNRLKAMEFALSMETRAAAASDAFDLAQDREYQLADDGKTLDPQGATAETRAVTPEERSATDDADHLDRHRNSTVAMSEILARGPSPTGTARSGGTHFTTYDQAARRRATSADGAGEQVSALRKIGPWLLAAATIGIAIWYLSRPAGPDVLLRKITDVAREGETSDLTRVEASIDEFLDRFPNHPQHGEVRALREELNLYRLQRRYERRARLRGGTDTLSPVERVYVETTLMAQSDPRAAAARLQALLDVYADFDTDAADRRCLMLAREQLEQLRARADEVAAEDIAAVRQRLDRAEEIRESDPERADSIRRGVIELYRDQPWARPAVERARAALESEPQSETSPPSPLSRATLNQKSLPIRLGRTYGDLDTLCPTGPESVT